MMILFELALKKEKDDMNFSAGLFNVYRSIIIVGYEFHGPHNVFPIISYFHFFINSLKQ